MEINNEAFPEKCPVFVVVTRETRIESEIDYNNKPYLRWSPEHVTCLEEFELVVHWAVSKRIPEPKELLEEMTRRKYPITLGLLESLLSTNHQSAA